MSPLIRHPKRRGEWVELQFMARAAKHGLTISKPYGDSARYDFIVEGNGKLHRVQVKSTTVFDGRSYICNTVSRGSNEKIHHGYTRDDIDFFVFYIIPEDVWYIVPIAVAAKAHFAVSLNPRSPRSRYYPYLEAWDLLKSPAQSASTTPSGQ